MGRFSGGVGRRVTGDICCKLNDSALSRRRNCAVAAYTPQGSPIAFKVGQIHTPWLDWEEALWDYRVQGTMAMDRAGYLSAADLGVGVDGKWGPDKVNFQLTVRSEEHTSELQSLAYLVCRLLLEKKKT